MATIIFAVVFFIVGCVLLFITSTGKYNFVIPPTFACFLISCFIIVAYYENKPKAIHVYQGKTTLEITYRDGVPVDSIVIFKTK